MRQNQELRLQKKRAQKLILYLLLKTKTQTQTHSVHSKRHLTNTYVYGGKSRIMWQLKQK